MNYIFIKNYFNLLDIEQLSQIFPGRPVQQRKNFGFREARILILVLPPSSLVIAIGQVGGEFICSSVSSSGK